MLFPDSSRPQLLSTGWGLRNEAINIIQDDNLSVCSPEITCETVVLEATSDCSRLHATI